MKRSFERILVDDVIPYFGNGNLVCEERLDEYFEAIAGPKGKAVHLMGKLSSAEAVKEYQAEELPDRYRGAIYGRILFGSRRAVRRFILDESRSEIPIVRAEKFREGDVLTVMADRLSRTRSARLEHNNGGWVEVQFFPEGEIMLRSSNLPTGPVEPTDANCAIMNNVADAIRIAERKPFVEL